jgi:uncharacterized membrane protein
VKAPTAVFAALLAVADRTTLVAKKLGLETVIWAALSASSLGLLVATRTSSEWMRGLLRSGATIATVWPALGTILGALLLVALALGLLAWWRERRSPGTAIDWVRLQTRRSSFVVALPIVLALSAPVEDSRSLTTIGLCFVAGALAAYSAYFWSREAPRGGTDARWKTIAPWLLGACALVYAGLIIRLSFINHWSFKTNRADLGFYMSVFRNSSLGSPLRCTLCVGETHSSGHFDPILVLLSPLYLLYPYSETILVLQTLWLASSVVPLYLLALRATGNPRIALALGAAFLAYPALHGVSLFDFHSLALVIPLLLWLAYCFQTERWKTYGVLLVLLLLCREDIALLLFTVGLAVLFSGKPKSGRIALLTMVTSIVYFVVAKKFFMTSSDPLNSGEGADSHAYYFAGLIPKGFATGGLVRTVITDPFLIVAKVLDDNKLEYVLTLLAPLMFLPLLGRGRICLGYGAFLTLVATRPIASVNYHYSSLLIPVLFALCIDALGRLSRGHFVPVEKGRRMCGPLTAGILVTTLLASWKFGGVLQNTAFRAGLRQQARALNPELVARAQWLHTVAKRLPRDTTISAASTVVPHLGRIRNVYMTGSKVPPEYLIYSSDFDAKIRRFVDQSIKSGRLVKVDQHASLTLYRNTDMKKKWMSD